MRRNGDRGLVGGDREILDRSYGFHRTGDRWLPDRWLGMPGSGVVVPPPFDPTTIAGLKGWWKVDALPVIADGSQIMSWTDSSGSLNHAIPTGANDTPRYTSNVLNGKPVARYSMATGQCLQLTTPVPIGPWTIFSVMKPSAATMDISSISSPGLDSVAGPLNNTGAYYIGSGGWYNTGRPADLNWHVITGNTTPQIFVDGIAMAGSYLNSSATGVLSHMGIRFNANYSNGDVAEILFYNSVLSAADTRKVHDYLLGKYALWPVPPWSVAGLTFWIDASQITVAGGALREAIKEKIVRGAIKHAAIRPTPQLNEPEITPLLVDGTPLSGWADKAGGGNNITGLGTYKTKVLGSRPVVRFNGTSDGMNAGSGNLTNYYGPLTTFAVAKLPAGVVSWITSWVGGGNYMGLTAPGHLHVGVPAAGTGIEDAADHSGVFHVFTGVYGGTDSTTGPSAAYVDGVQVATGINRSYVSILGIMKDGAIAYPGDLAEVLTFRGVLSDADRQAIENYLISKYNTPYTPPTTRRFLDNFTDPGTAVPITSHTSDSGHTWGLAMPGYGSGLTGIVLDGGVAHYNNTLNSNDIHSSYIPSTPDVEATITLVVGALSGSPAPEAGMWLRATSDSANPRGYMGRAVQGLFQIYRLDTAINYINLANVAGSIADGDQLTFTAFGSGAVVSLNLMKNGVSVCSVDDNQPNRIVTTGKVGMHIHDSTYTGNFRVTKMEVI